MAPVRDLSAAQLAFQIVGGDVDQFIVVRYRGTEGLCRLFRFEIDVISPDSNIDVDKIIGTSAILMVQSQFGDRTFHGLVSRFECFGEGAGSSRRTSNSPRSWLLTHRYQSRIFQQKTVPEIVSQVFKDAGISADCLKQKLNGTYNPREYCVQYRETDYNFVCRLMEEEGIWWYFEHSKESHVMIMADAPSNYTPIDDDPSLAYMPIMGLEPQVEHVFRFRRSQTVRPGVVTLRDFNFERPDLDLQTKQDLGRDSASSSATTRANTRSSRKARNWPSSAARSSRPAVSPPSARATAADLPRRTFQLTGHPATACNDSYVITSIAYQGQQATDMASIYAATQSQALRSDLVQSLVTACQTDNPQVRAGGGNPSSRLPARPRTPRYSRRSCRWLYHSGQIVRDLATAAQALGGSPLRALAFAGLWS